MSDDKEPLDPADWLSSQFDTDALPKQPEPAAEPVPPVLPPQPVPPVAPAVPSQPAAPLQPDAQQPVVPTALPADPPADSGSPFPWGLTPGDELPPAPTSPEPAPSAPEPTPTFPESVEGNPPLNPAAPVPPVPTAAPPAAAPPAAAPPVIPAAPIIPPPTLPAYEPPATPPAPPTDLPPTQLILEQVVPGHDLEPQPWDPWQARPVDSSLDGLTEVIEAEIVGLEPPVDESNPTATPTMDDLFADGQFRDADADADAGPDSSTPPPSRPRGEKSAKGEHAPLPKTQKTLIGVALGLVAALALVALFLVGQRLASTAPAPAVIASPSPTATPTTEPTTGPLPAGPLAPGDYQWDELLGGECLAEYESAWQDRYTVVDCTTPHPAQMVYRGTFTDDAAAAFPGVEELNSRINLLCTAPTVINYQIAGTAADIQVTASFAATADDWDAGDRTYFCFVNRASGEPLTASVAQPQPAQ